MRLLRFLLWCAVLGTLVILALLVLIQNVHTEHLVFFGVEYVTNFVVAMLGAIGFGFMLALLLMIPGRIAAALYGRALERELRHVERQVAALSDQRERLLEGQERILMRYERLYADHDKAVAERDRMRARLDAIIASQAKPAAPTAAPTRAAAPLVATVLVDKPHAVPATAVRSARVLPPVAPALVASAPVAPAPVAPAPVAPPAPVPVADATSPPADLPPAAAPAAAPPRRADTGRPQRRITLTNISVPLDRWRGQVVRWGARVRQSTGAVYNDMRESLTASSRALVPMMRARVWRDTSYDGTSGVTSTADEVEQESTTLKGE